MNENESGNDKPKIAPKHLARVKIEEYIGKNGGHKPEDVVTDETLTEISGVDCTSERGRGFVQRSIGFVAKWHGMCWRRVPGAGCIECLGPSGARQFAESNTKAITRKAKRNVVYLTNTTQYEMENGERIEHNLALAQSGTLCMFDGKLAKKLKARDVQKPLNMNRLLEAFQRDGD